VRKKERLRKESVMQPLQPNRSYHVFNHANGFENVFREEENYRFFLAKYRLYIAPVAETFTYCLMPNHFHLVVRIRKREVIEELVRNKSNSSFSKVSNFGKVEKPIENDKIEDVDIEQFLSKQFANFFSCYTQSFNKMYKRMGSLFIKNFKREIITDKEHFINAVVYTHRNPIHHGFCTSFTGWGYSSYLEILDRKNDVVAVDKTVKVFGSIALFEQAHADNLDTFNRIDDLETP
jgi:REP element-mobilizing transposase RayT